MKNPHEVQFRLLKQLIEEGKSTEYGQNNSLSTVKDYHDFARALPLTEYEDLKPFIDRMMMGEKSVLWPGQVKWY
jgi:hypothetical protein